MLTIADFLFTTRRHRDCANSIKRRVCVMWGGWPPTLPRTPRKPPRERILPRGVKSCENKVKKRTFAIRMRKMSNGAQFFSPGKRFRTRRAKKWPCYEICVHPPLNIMDEQTPLNADIWDETCPYGQDPSQFTALRGVYASPMVTVLFQESAKGRHICEDWVRNRLFGKK